MKRKPKKAEDNKTIKQLKSEFSKLKEDYKDVLKAIKDETFARNKAEEEARVLKATLEAQNDLKSPLIDIDKTDNEKMDTEDVFEALKPKIKTFDCNMCSEKYKAESDFEIHKKSQHKEQQKSCNNCTLVFRTSEELQIHGLTHKIGSFNCNKCEIPFRSEMELTTHLKMHRIDEPYKCEFCEDTFDTKKSLTDHALEHVSNKSINCNKSSKMSGPVAQSTEHDERSRMTEINCNKCEKAYTSMSNLRRHDWRSHRAVKCNICDETIENRHEIGNHRRSKHQLYKKSICRYYPECLDGDECLFAHEQPKGFKNGGPICPNGQTCSDQSCRYSEAYHRSAKDILCKFQAQCNRKFCPFQHSVARLAFLADASLLKNQK